MSTKRNRHQSEIDKLKAANLLLGQRLGNAEGKVLVLESQIRGLMDRNNVLQKAGTISHAAIAFVRVLVNDATERT
jgi:hypothetical protein